MKDYSGAKPRPAHPAFWQPWQLRSNSRPGRWTARASVWMLAFGLVAPLAAGNDPVGFDVPTRLAMQTSVDREPRAPGQAASPAARAGSERLDADESPATRHEYRSGADSQPGTKVYEIRFPVSVLASLQANSRVSVVRLDLRFSDPTTEVLAFSPESQLVTSVVGNIAIERKHEGGKSGGVKLDLLQPFSLKGTAGVDLSQKDSAMERFEQRPELTRLTTSGTLDRGRGVSYQLYASPQRELEGSHELWVRFRVADPGRAQLLKIQCVAWSRGSNPLSASGLIGSAEKRILGQRCFNVALYRDGDAEALGWAQHFITEEEGLYEAAQQYKQRIERVRYPTVLHRLGDWAEVYEPRLHPQWLDQLLFDSDMPAPGSLSQLPGGLRQRIQNYDRARQQLTSRASASQASTSQVPQH